MDSKETTPRVRVRYWAGAKAAAGVESEQLCASNVGELRRAVVAAHPAMAEIIQRCSVLVKGARSNDDAPLSDGAEAEMLPPFAGG